MNNVVESYKVYRVHKATSESLDYFVTLYFLLFTKKSEILYG